MNFTDTTNSSFIDGATASFTFNGETYDYNGTFNDMYWWNIPVIDLEVGTFNLTLTISKIYFFNKTYSFNISVYDLPTSAADQFSISQPLHNSSVLSDEPYLVYTAYSLTINCSYWDTNNTAAEKYILDASVVLYIDSNEIIPTLTQFNDTAYGWVIDISSYLGLHTIWLNFSKLHYINASYSFDINVDHQTTDVQLVDISQEEHTGDTLVQDVAPDYNYTVYMRYGLNISLFYFDPTNSDTPIESATVTFWLNETSYSGFYSGTNFLVNITAADLRLKAGDLVPVIIHFNATFHYNQTLAFNLTIIELPSEAALVSISQPDDAGELVQDLTYFNYTVYRAYSLYLNFSFVDPTDGNAPIMDANVSFMYDEVPYNSSGAPYSWLIPIENLTVGQEIITIYFSRIGIETQTFVLNITVFDLPTEILDLQVSQKSTITPVGEVYSLFDTYNLSISLTYWDSYNSINIPNAPWIVITLNGTPYFGSYSDPKYSWFILADNLEYGEYNCTIMLGKNDHKNITQSYTFMVEILRTSITFNEPIENNDLRQPSRPDYLNNPVVFVDPIYHVFLHYDVVIEVNYYSEIDTQNLNNADFALLNYSNFLVFATEVTLGNYRFTIPVAELILGLNTITLQFEKLTYANAILDIEIYVHVLNTSIANTELAQPDHAGIIGAPVVNNTNYEIYLPFDSTFELKFVDVNNTLDLDGATVSFSLDGTLLILDSQANGIYSWIISKDQINVGDYEVIITLGMDDYQNQTFTITLSVMIVETEGELGAILQPGYDDSLPYDSVSGTYLAFSPFNVTIRYNITDIITDDLITEFLLANLTMESGYSFEGIYENGYFSFEIPAAQLTVGLVNITITFEKYGYENITVDLVFDVFEEYSVTIATIEVPTAVIQGDKFSLVLRLTYNNGTDDLPLVGETVSLTTDHADLRLIENVTGDDGYVYFEFILPTGDYTSLNITVEYNGQKYGIDSGNKGFSVQVSKTPAVSMWLVYLILGFVGFVAMVVTIQKKIIAPRRMHFTDMVMSSATIFEDAINIQHVMIIYKSWGTSIFFKSFADDTIDPDLISGFLSAVQSFGKELKSQSALNELSYGDKILQFMDGEFIRVTLVLSKSASPYLKRNLSKFVSVFEVEFKETLEKWRGQLNVFQGTEDLIDEVLKTSVILPHQFNPEMKKPKDISRALTKQLLGTAKSLIVEDRPFLFLAQILQQAIDETRKGAPEIILSITELLDRKILIPVKFEQIAKEEITEAKKGEIHARVWKIQNKTNAEKEELYTQLLELSEAEREVTLSSLLQTVTITSEYTKEEYEVPKFTKAKDAKSEMNSLISQAKKTLKAKEFDQALKYYEFAEIIAIQWNFKDKAKTIEGNILATTVEKNRYIIKTARKAGRKFERSKDYEHSGEEYQKALDSAHKLYQLGLEDVDEDIKTLTHKVIENKQECVEGLTNEDCVNSDVLIKSRKKLIQTYAKKNKSMNRDEKIENLTRIAVISNLLFKFGASSEIKFVKTYQKKIEDLKKSLKKESNEIQAQNAAAVATSQEMSSMLDKMRKEAELDQNWFNAIILYQKRLNIEYKLGNIDRGVYLAGQIRSKISKIPYIFDLIDETREKIKSAKEQSNSAELQQNEDLLKMLLQIMFNFD